jgi:hypothetical protein
MQSIENVVAQKYQKPIKSISSYFKPRANKCIENIFEDKMHSSYKKKSVEGRGDEEKTNDNK